MNHQEPTKQNYQVALDVGTTKVVAIAGKLNSHGKIEMLGYSVLVNTGVQQGEIFNLLSTSDTILHVKEDMKIKYDIDVERVVVGLSGDHLRVRNIFESITRENDEDLIDETDIKKLNAEVSYAVKLEENEEILDIIPQYYHIDGKGPVTNPVGTLGRKLEGNFLVIIGNKKKIELLKRSVHMAGLEIDKIYLQSVASALAVLNKGQMRAGTLLIDIGGGTTDVIIVKDEIIRYTDVIPFGGDDLTGAIQKRLFLLPEKAEYLKIKYGSLMQHADDNRVFEVDMGWNNKKKYIPAKDLSRIIQEKMDYLASLIKNRILENNPGFSMKDLLGGVVVTGGGAEIKHIKQFFADRFQLEVELGKPDVHLTTADLHITKPKFATVIGLLKNSLEQGLEIQRAGDRTLPEIEEQNQTNQESGELFSGLDKEISRNEEKNKNGSINKFLRKIQTFITDVK